MRHRTVYSTILILAAIGLVIAILWPDEPAVSFKMNSSQFVAEFLQDETLAMKKYAGKKLEITGEVASYNKDNGILLLRSENEVSVSCALLMKELPNEILLNELVTVRGVCTGMLLDVQLSECTLQ